MDEFEMRLLAAFRSIPDEAARRHEMEAMEFRAEYYKQLKQDREEE